jgi:hypothetical protein
MPLERHTREGVAPETDVLWSEPGRRRNVWGLSAFLMNNAGVAGARRGR